MKDETHHVPVLLEEILALFQEHVSSPNPRIFDGTLGGAGHSAALLERFPHGSLLAFDRDPHALERARKRLEKFGDRVMLAHENFRELSQVAEGRFDAMILDLGISSDQLDDMSRGFSFQPESSLDMRMDTTQGLTAAEILNTSSHGKLSRIFERGGLRRHARRLASEIIADRPIESAAQLSAICEQVIASPREKRLKQERGGSSHARAATVPFQALRMAVNDELGAVEEFLTGAPEVAASGGVLAVITFHSLEDEIVAKRFRSWGRPQGATRQLPGKPPLGVHLTQKPIVSGARESSINPRARSARLRAFKFAEVA